MIKQSLRCLQILGLLCLAGVWPAWMPHAQAHKASDAYVQLVVDGARITARWDVSLRDLDNVLKLDADEDGQINWGEVRTRWDDIQGLVWPRLQLDAGSGHCRPDPVFAKAELDDHNDGAYAVLHGAWQCDAVPHVLRLNYTLFADTDATHRGIVSIEAPLLGQPEAAPLSLVMAPDGGERRVVLAEPSPWQTFSEFWREGVSHIAGGIDHLLFLLVLLLPAVLRQAPPAGGGAVWLAAPAWRPVVADVVKVVTAFTLAHSITLALAVWGWVSLPSRWVESAIAASVVLAALNNIWPVVRDGRWALTFAFGLIHGFGFAGALQDLGLRDAPLGWSLLGFNAGVESGQLAVVALFVPLAWWARSSAFYQRRVLGGGSAIIALLATLWLVERAADLSLGLPV